MSYWISAPGPGSSHWAPGTIPRPQWVNMEHVGTGSPLTKKNSKMLGNLYTWFKFNSVTDDPQLKSMLESLYSGMKNILAQRVCSFLFIPVSCIHKWNRILPFIALKREYSWSGFIIYGLLNHRPNNFHPRKLENAVCNMAAFLMFLSTSMF